MGQGLLGIDVGTTAVKLMFIENGEARWSTSRRIHTYHESGVTRYQKAKEIIACVDASVHELPEYLRHRVCKISFSVAMHSVMPVLSEEDNPVFIWSDNQAEDTLMQELTPELRERFYLLTGTPIHPMSPFAKILHFKKQRIYPEKTVWLGLKELLMQYFTGETVIDLSTASATGLCGIESMGWEKEILDFIGIKEEDLAPIVSPTAVFSLLSERENQYGFSSGVEVICGASDGTLAALAGLMTTGISNSLTIGTSAAVRIIQKEKWLDVERQNFCYRLDEETFVLGAPSNNGGSVLEWTMQFFGDTPEEFYPMLQHHLIHSDIGANGVKFYPFLTGERAPYWNTKIKAEFKGLGASTSKSAIIRSILEGMLLNIKNLLDIVPLSGPLSLNGGFFQTEILTQMLVDILGVESILSSENEPIYGLYYLIFSEKVEGTQSTDFIYPNEERLQSYAKLAQNYFDEVLIC
ncbi:MAG: gluconokinase [Enterococcus sp.]